jgi:hypothetical protein
MDGEEPTEPALKAHAHLFDGRLDLGSGREAVREWLTLRGSEFE